MGVAGISVEIPSNGLVGERSGGEGIRKLEGGNTQKLSCITNLRAIGHVQ